MNTYGSRFRVTTYGESHGLAVGAIIDGCPAGLQIDMEAIRHDLSRRSNGAPRQEEDAVEWLSGIVDGVTLGTPLAFAVRNHNAKPGDYDALRHLFRPGHADYTYQTKYGIRDHRGGGRASARETVARVVAGSIAKQILKPVEINACVLRTGPELSNDTTGGVVECSIEHLQAGVGDPVFGKLGAQLAAAVMSIPSAIGFELGVGFDAATMAGSEYVDQWDSSADGTTVTNHCGGIQGGISNGMPVVFRVAFHPVVTLPQPIDCLSDTHNIETIMVNGRHDNRHIYRTPVIVEAMAALCLINAIS